MTEENKKVVLPLLQAEQIYSELKRLKQKNENLREAMHKDFCSHYVLGECSEKHHNNCVGRNQCIKDLEQENEKLKEAYDEIFNNSEILHENNCLRISNQKLLEDLEQAETSMMAWKEDCIKLRKALEEIRSILNKECGVIGNAKAVGIINEVLNPSEG